MVPGETLFSQGHPPEPSVVLDGYVALDRVSVDGAQTLAILLRPGDTLGITALLPHDAVVQATALTAGGILVLPASRVRSLTETDNGFARDCLRHALWAIVRLAERLDTLRYQKADQRVARILLRHEALFFADPPVLRQAHLPAIVGTSREMVSRGLRRLESCGILLRTPVGLRLIDPEGLRRAAGPMTRDEAGTSS